MDATSLLLGAGGLFAGLIIGNPASRRLFRALWHISTVSGNDKVKLVLVVRPDLGMSSGKIAAQCAHAAVMSYRSAEERTPNLCQLWLSTGQQKVVVKCDSPGQEGLMKYVQLAKSKGIITSTVLDAGHTQVKRGSLTVIGIGPGPESLINQVTGKLKIF